MDTPTAERLAKAAGLVRLPADAPGISRRRCGRGFTYRSARGTPLGSAERDRVEGLAIPPAWTEVWIAPDPESHVLATGLDDAGRKQYLYHPRWREAADQLKFERLPSFGRELIGLRKRVVRDLRSDDERSAHCAALLRLIDLSLIRAGSRCYANENGTFGATTLLASHVEVKGSTVHLTFPGKGGNELELSVTDRLLAGHLRRLVATLDDDSHLFVDGEGRPVDREDVNEYIAETAGTFTVKDFRTWGATCAVAGLLAAPAKGDEPDACVRAAIEQTAEALGNTPAVCRSSYVAPAVVEAHLDGTLAAAWRASRTSRWMSRSERATQRVLSSA